MLVQAWSHDSDNVLITYRSYSGNMHVVILNEIIFWSNNGELF